MGFDGVSELFGQFADKVIFKKDPGKLFLIKKTARYDMELDGIGKVAFSYNDSNRANIIECITHNSKFLSLNNRGEIVGLETWVGVGVTTQNLSTLDGLRGYFADNFGWTIQQVARDEFAAGLV